MLSGQDDAAFETVMRDLCLAFDRPYDVERTRVFWEALKHVNIGDVKRFAITYRKSGKKFPAPRDLMPERTAPTPLQVTANDPRMSRWAVAANTILFALAYLDERRGFKPIAVWEPTPPNGWGLPLRLPKLIDGTRLDRCLHAKRDLVGLAEQDDSAGQPWAEREFNIACRQAFEQILTTTSEIAA